MAGIYIHIPFCRQACIYCNFHFSTSLRNKSAMIAAMKEELRLRKDYAGGETIETIYFGGGTPSLLQADEVEQLLGEIARNHSISTDAEITLEANPDDLSIEYLRSLHSIGINRLSIGIQSFFEDELQRLNRAHSAEQAVRCLDAARNTGFELLTLDLIFGIPGQSIQRWEANLRWVKHFEIPHFSAYALTVEPRTALEHQIRKGKSAEIDEQQIEEHFLFLQSWSLENGYEPYEISNYALPGRRSRHNTAYWKGDKYLGIGPSAHSFDGQGRQWNISNNNRYLDALMKGEVHQEAEILTNAQRYNEYIMTSMRTIEGADLDHIAGRFGQEYIREMKEPLQKYMHEGFLQIIGNRVFLNAKGRLWSDRIIAELFTSHE